MTDEQRSARDRHIPLHEERKVYLAEKKTTVFEHKRVFVLAFGVNTMHEG